MLSGITRMEIMNLLAPVVIIGYVPHLQPLCGTAAVQFSVLATKLSNNDK